MIKQLETTLFFAATVSALALASVIGVQELSASPDVQQAVTMPTFKLEAVEIVGQRTPRHLAPEQVALVR